jgi:hypothetical protein
MRFLQCPLEAQAVRLQVLVFVHDNHSLDVSLHHSRAAALQAGAEQAMHLILAESLVDLHGALGRMEGAFEDHDYNEVIRLFEKAKRHKAVFICEAAVPELCSP